MERSAGSRAKRSYKVEQDHKPRSKNGPGLK